MKKVIWLLVVLSTLLTACRKNYTCTCSNPASSGYAANTTIIKEKSYKKDAEAWCAGYQTIPNIPPGTTCTLK